MRSDDPSYVVSPPGLFLGGGFSDSEPILPQFKIVMNPKDSRLIVFAKTPLSGRVKTRLASSIGASAAARLYRQMILHSLSIAVEARVGAVDLWCTPSARHPFFLQCARDYSVSLFHQRGRDLGLRMAFAFRETLKRVSSALLIGTDCPSLTVKDIREAMDVLGQGMDAVIGPASDGGYVLIGLRKIPPRFFSGISWGTGSVLSETRQRLKDLGWKWHELKELWDVDRPEDVERLIREGCLPEGMEK